MKQSRGNKINKKATELCQLIEDLLYPIKENKLDENLYSERDLGKIIRLQRFFGLKKIAEVIVFCILIENRLSNDRFPTLHRIAKALEVTLTGMVEINYTLQSLIKRRLVVSKSRGSEDSPQFTLSQKCFNAILKYDKQYFKKTKHTNFENFLSELEQIRDLKREFILNDDDIAISELIYELIDNYSNVTEIKWLKSQGLSNSDEALLSFTIFSHIVDQSTLNLNSILPLITTDRFEVFKIEKSILNGKHDLLTGDYICISPDIFRNVTELSLTEKTIKAMCSDYQLKKKEQYSPTMFKMQYPEPFGEVYLHNNPELEAIEKMVSHDFYDKLKNKVPRLSILLTGAPGVGKTSFINHLSRQSGRVILSANIAQILSCYVGESEKNLVKIFQEAEQAYKLMEIEPIIVFDEAEALLFSRKTKNENAVSQMNNNIISLLLASLDKFRGILICCSNFDFKTGLFDEALHRRFYQICKIEAPTGKALKAIMCCYFPNFEEKQIIEFLTEFPKITPAQIKNLKNRVEVYTMLNETEISLEILKKFAANDIDFMNKNQHRKIGYCCS